MADLKELRVLNIGGVDYNVGFSANDLTDALKSAYDKAVTDSESALTAFEGLKLVQITEGLDANVREAFELHDKDGNKLGDATIKVYKDSSLQNVELRKIDANGKYSDEEGYDAETAKDSDVLRFTYELTDGTTSVQDVKLGSFLMEAEFKNGLEVNENGEVNVALGASTDSNKNFLELEGTDGSQVLAVRDMDADVTVTTEAIPVAGGPLASLYTNAGLGSEIAAGTDLQALLFSLFCKEIYPTVSQTAASLTAKVAAPTITLGTTETVEIGTEVSVAIANEASSYTATPAKVSGMTNGYSTSDNDTQEKTATSISGATFTAEVDSEHATTTLTANFNGESHTTDGDAAAGSAKFETSINAIEGNYTITAKSTSVGYKATSTKLDAVYYCSNLKKTDASKVTTARAATELTAAPVTSSTTSKTIKGAFKYFVSYASAVPTTKAELLAATSLMSGFITPDKGDTLTKGGVLPGGNVMIIAVPEKYKVTDIRNGMNLESLGSFAETEIDYGFADGSIFKYRIYAFSSGSDWNFGNIVITNA